MSTRESIARSEHIPPPQHHYTSGSTEDSYTYIQGDYSGNSGSHNIVDSHNFRNSGSIATYSCTTHGNTTYNYFGNTISRPSNAEILQCLYTSTYPSHRGRIREPAKGTCTWVTEHPKYKDWLGSKTSALLWLSADPGCGKSVIASFLVRHLGIAKNAIICYFFFKDDSEEQRSATFALCALLHQLFAQRNELCRYAEAAFMEKGKRFTEEVDTLWDILIEAVAEGGSGEVICVVDALDECDGGTLSQLTRRLASLPVSQTPDIPLKFLVTGRPYHRIEREFGSPATTIRLRGEDQVEAISADVARVIDEGIRDLELYWRHPGGLGYLRELLKSSADRTFLWVSLILDVLKNSPDGIHEAFLELVSTAPLRLPELYTKILNKSADPDQARRILHIVVAATRPLTLRELIIAFRIRRDHTSIKDIGGLSPGSETMVKNVCGLFVRIIDSKVYLVHQTAREFLIKEAFPGRGNWLYTLSPVNSHFILADICITYLALEDFESDPLFLDTSSGASWQRTHDYCEKYALLHYAASHWADHFRDSQYRQMELVESTRLICKRGSNKFLTWLKVYWENSGTYHPFPNDFTHLMIAGWLGQRIVVERLLKDGGDINARSEKYGTALNVAALGGNRDIAGALIKRGVKAYIRGKEYNISLMLRGELERHASLDSSSDSDSWSMVSRKSSATWVTARRSMDSVRSWWTARSNMSVESWSMMSSGGAYPDMDYEVIVFLLPYCIQGVNDLRTLPRRLVDSLRSTATQATD